MTLTSFLIVLTALDLTLIILLIGLFVTEAWLIPSGLRVVAQQRIKLHLLALLIMNTLLLLLTRSLILCQCAWPTFLGLLPAILTQTHLGKIALLRLLTLSLWSYSLWADWPKSRIWQLLFIAILLFSVSAVSHAAGAGDFSWRALLGALHLLFAATWLGSLIVVTLAVVPEVGTLSHPVMQQLLYRLSRLALWSVMGVVMTGAYQSYRILHPISMLWTNLYGMILLAKLCVIGVMILLGGSNRLLFIPAWVARPSAISWRKVHVTLLTETLLAPLLICLAAALMNTMPPAMY